MYQVTTSHLGPDARRIRAGSENLDRGDMSAAEFTTLLDAFCEIDAVENEDFDPSIVAAGRGAKLIIRTSRGRLQVYDIRDHSAPAVETTVAGLLERLDRIPETRSPFGDLEPEQPVPTAPHRGIAFAMLVWRFLPSHSSLTVLLGAGVAWLSISVLTWWIRKAL